MKIVAEQLDEHFLKFFFANFSKGLKAVEFIPKVLYILIFCCLCVWDLASLETKRVTSCQREEIEQHNFNMSRITILICVIQKLLNIFQIIAYFSNLNF